MQREGRTVFISASANDQNKPTPLVVKFLQNIVFYAVVVGFSIALFYTEKDWNNKQEAVNHVRFALRRAEEEALRPFGLDVSFSALPSFVVLCLSLSHSLFIVPFLH